MSLRAGEQQVVEHLHNPDAALVRLRRDVAEHLDRVLGPERGEALQVLVHAGEHPVLDGGARGAQRLPVLQLVHHRHALGADGGGRLPQVAAKLRVVDRVARRLLEGDARAPVEEPRGLADVGPGGRDVGRVRVATLVSPSPSSMPPPCPGSSPPIWLRHSMRRLIWQGRDTGQGLGAPADHKNPGE